MRSVLRSTSAPRRTFFQHAGVPIKPVKPIKPAAVGVNPPPAQPFPQPVKQLNNLVGTWTGYGLNMITLPDFDKNAPSTGPKLFRILPNATREELTFSVVGAVANRGTAPSLTPTSPPPSSSTPGQSDITIQALNYVQKVQQITNDVKTNLLDIHFETGLFLAIPPTNFPQQSGQMVRQGSIPHGNTVLMTGQAITLNKVVPNLLLPVATVAPRPAPGQPALPANYFQTAFDVLPWTPINNITKAMLANPALYLQFQAANFNFPPPVMDFIPLSSEVQPPGNVPVNPTIGAGALGNIPFAVPNAAPVRVQSTFWNEFVVVNGVQMNFLQYSQVVDLQFNGVIWPHVSVATLAKDAAGLAFLQQINGTTAQ